MTAPARMQCPACGGIVDADDLVVTETPEDWQKVDVSDLDAGLPEKYRGTEAVKCHVRAVHVTTQCKDCAAKHVH